MDAKMLSQIKQDILTGKLSLRSAAVQYGIDRDKLKEMIKGQLKEKSDNDRFRERMKLNQKSSIIPFDERVKKIVISILKGEITAKDASKEYHIDKETIRRKMAELVEKDDQYLELYLKYKNQSAIDYGTINFKGLIIYMIRENMSQSELATQYDIPARTISREIEKLGKSKNEKDLKLYNIAKIHADRKRKRQELSVYEVALYDKILSELFPDEPVVLFESSIETEIKRLEDFVGLVESYQEQKMTIEQIAQKMGMSVSTIRRNKLKLEELKKQEKYKEKLQKKDGQSIGE